jgi:SAM-dependent methyltransferase
MRTERINTSTPELDNQERVWWNNNAETIEKIWAQNIHFQNVVRLPYLKKMKRFFLKDKSKATILEIGCGTGWVGRLVADESINFIGTDFSEGQLAIAKQKAKGKENFLKYELADASTFEKDVDGVLIHALLHHLSSEELNLFFREFSKLKRGTKIFIYEPVFYGHNPSAPSFKDRVINKLIYVIKNKFTKPQRDIDLMAAMKKINEDAENNGWYISPKEVPFYDGELEKFINPYCELENKYIVNKSDYEISQSLTMSGIDKPSLLYSELIIPFLARLDQMAFKGNFRHYLYPHQHLFTCYEWVKK